MVNFLPNVAQFLGDFLGYFNMHHFLSKTGCGYFWATFWKIWANFFPTSRSHWTREQMVPLVTYITDPTVNALDNVTTFQLTVRSCE